MNVMESQAVVAPVADHWLQSLSTTQSTAMKLLGQGIAPVMVASTLGVSESLVSQFMSEERFAAEVTRLKLGALQKQTAVDNKYLQAEDMLADKLLKSIPMMTNPLTILKGIQVINGTKRRGVADSGVINQQTQIVQLVLPGAFAAKFVTNAQNQIVEVQDGDGARSLITTTPAALDRLAQEVNRLPEIAAEPGWQESSSPEYLLQQASQRIQESGVSETLPKGLRRSLEVKGKITENDL